MKYAVIVGDGMSDYGVEELGGKTPLQVANKPNIDRIACEGLCGSVKTIPNGLEPGSDIANMSILGYDPRKYYTGRGPFEALSKNIKLKKDEIAFRCNLTTVDNGIMADYSAGHIKTEEAKIIIEYLNKKLGRKGLRFCAGVSYRHLLIVSKDVLGSDAEHLKCVPPHDISGKPTQPNLPSGKGSRFLKKLMQESVDVLKDNDINSVRVDLRENPANMIWLWGAGKLPRIPLFKERFGLSSAIISAVDLLKGIGKALGMDVIDVPGATGYYDTNYEGKASYAIKALLEKDLLFIHVEAPDEAGHNGDVRQKIKAIENIDKKIVKPVYDYLVKQGDFRILFLCDHATPVSLKTHTRDPVPFCMCGSGVDACGCKKYEEKCCEVPCRKFEAGHKLMQYFVES